MPADELTLTFPEGDVFEGGGNLTVTYRTTTNWLLSNSGNISQVFNQYLANTGGQGDGSSSLKQSLRLGSGAGTHAITVQFTDWQGHTAAWGDADPDDPPLIKLQTLDHAINTQEISGTSAIQFEHGAYSTAGKYDPIDVVVDEAQLVLDTGDGPSTHTPQLTLVDVFVLNQTADASLNDGT